MEGDLFASVIPTVEVELFEAQRYQPRTGAGETCWSADYLMPTEKRRYRVRQGNGSQCNASWSTLREVDANMLPLGWKWDHQQWRPQADTPTDKEGWVYGTAWTTNFEGKPESGQFTMVRWRRMVRLQTFAGTAAFMIAVGEAGDIVGCPNVDLEMASTIGRQLLEALTAASLRCEWSVPQLVKLKSALVEKLRDKNPKVRSVKAVLDEFVEAQGGMFQKWGRQDDGAAASQSGEEAKKRVEELETRFPLVEREVLAAFAMRRICPDHTCRAPDGQDPEHDCPFQQLLCSNRGCCERISQRNAQAHDDACVFKCVPCERCGEEVRRKEMPAHLSAACPERPISCSFESIGCTKQVSRRSVEKHLDECTQAHLMLMMRQLHDQQDQINDLVRAAEVDRETFAKARESDRKQLGELSLTVGSMRTKLEKQGDFSDDIAAVQKNIRKLELSMRNR